MTLVWVFPPSFTNYDVRGEVTTCATRILARDQRLTRAVVSEFSGIQADISTTDSPPDNPRTRASRRASAPPAPAQETRTPGHVAAAPVSTPVVALPPEALLLDEAAIVDRRDEQEAALAGAAQPSQSLVAPDSRESGVQGHGSQTD